MIDPHEQWMQLALEEARRGVGLTHPNPPVGAVIVRDGRVISRGWHSKAGSDHAEKAALKNAGREAAAGADLYVTLEPCSTHGRTEPCTDWILDYKINRVIVGAVDPNPAHAGRGITILEQQGIPVVSGVCRQEAEALIAPFKKWVLTQTPFVTLKLAISADGCIADSNGASKWITGPEAREKVQALRRTADAVLVGSETVRMDNPSLLPRPDGGRRPLRVIADSLARISPDANVLTDGNADQTVIAVTAQAPKDRRELIAATGAQVWVLPSVANHVSLTALLQRLGENGLLHVLCEGGGTLAEGLLKENQVDRIALFIAPMIIGGDAARRAIAGTGWSMRNAPRFGWDAMERCGNDIYLETIINTE